MGFVESANEIPSILSPQFCCRSWVGSFSPSKSLLPLPRWTDGMDGCLEIPQTHLSAEYIYVANNDRSGRVYSRYYYLPFGHIVIFSQLKLRFPTRNSFIIIVIIIITPDRVAWNVQEK